MTKYSRKLNWLRASVLGANDGIVSIAGLVVGVAGATGSQGVIFTAGLAGIVAGAISMASGEYISVSSSRDTELSLLRKERSELKNNPDRELEELVEMYEKKGLKKTTAITVAKELTARDPIAAHFDVELGIDPNDLTSPWNAAVASAAAFLVGALIPLFSIIISPASARIQITFFSVIIALVLTGILSAKIGEANPMRATIRIVLGGALAMMITYGVGRLFQVSGI